MMLTGNAARVFWLVVLVGMLFVLAWVGRDTVYGWMSHRWPRERGVVVESRGIRSQFPGDDQPSYHAVIRYRYAVAERIYTNHVVRFGPQEASREASERLLRQLPVGREVGVRYRPSDPQVATLLPGTAPLPGIVLGLMVMLTLYPAYGLVSGRSIRLGTRRR